MEVRFELEGRKIPWKRRQLSVWKYRELLPVHRNQPITTLFEGGTGLHHCQRLGKRLSLRKLYVKNEGENPTGSFKDRGMTVAVSKARELGKRRVICASTGNTSASLSAYAARAGMECTVFIPQGKVASGKMLQVLMHAAKIVQVKGNFDPAWKGFKEFHELDIVKDRPRMMGIQAEGAAPIVRAFKQKRKRIRPVTNPQTVATAIRIGSPVNAPKVLNALNESEGLAEMVKDSEILNAQRELARLEGIFVEPASAASIAGLEKLLQAGQIERSDLIVCVTTGHGLKDPSVANSFQSPGYTLNIGDLSSLTALEKSL